MEFTGYKKIHKSNTSKSRLTVVEWPSGGVTVHSSKSEGDGVWMGTSTNLSKAEAARLIKLLQKATKS